MCDVESPCNKEKGEKGLERLLGRPASTAGHTQPPVTPVPEVLVSDQLHSLHAQTHMQVDRRKSFLRKWRELVSPKEVFSTILGGCFWNIMCLMSPACMNIHREAYFKS